MIKFGRHYKADPRDRKFRLTPPTFSLRTERSWRDTQWNGNQGSTPHCVGFAWTHLLSASPTSQFVDPDGLYELAKFLDEWVGEKYEGTSVRAGAKVLQHLGFFKEYHWAKNLDDVVKQVLEVGPVVCGTNWYSGMMIPDKAKMIHPTGVVEGGHAYVITGVNQPKELFRIKQSWGLEWGQKGHCWITFTEFARLMSEQGEVCCPIEIRPKGK